MAIRIVCNRPYEIGRELTCSDDCHQKLVNRLIAEFGEYKKVVRLSTGVAYRVPTGDIIGKGLREQDLDRYPICREGQCFMESDNLKLNHQLPSTVVDGIGGISADTLSLKNHRLHNVSPLATIWEDGAKDHA